MRVVVHFKETGIANKQKRSNLPTVFNNGPFENVKVALEPSWKKIMKTVSRKWIILLDYAQYQKT